VLAAPSRTRALTARTTDYPAPFGARKLRMISTFSDLQLVEPLQHAVQGEGYTHPTPIQSQSIPHLLAGRDLLGCAQTGTGKTAAFGLPILQRLSSAKARSAAHAPRALILVPTRELAAQVAESLGTYGRGLSLSVAVIYGGVGQAPQVRALARGVDILVATPGRLLDLMQQRHARLDQVEVVVLDEADHMLDLGFLPDVRRILAAVPKRRQTLLFSATMPPLIARLAESILSNPVQVFVSPAATTVELVEQQVHFVGRAHKPALLARVLRDPAVARALVFARTKRGADKVARRLAQDGIPAQAIHGNKSQGARERTLKGFRDGRARVLVATDIAARGIDVDGVTHVVNYDMPNVPESYVHRIGRTARAGASGVAISFVDGEEREYLRDIERLIQRKLNVAGGAEHASYERAPGPSRHAPRERQHAPRAEPRAHVQRHGAPRDRATPQRASRPSAPSVHRSPAPAPRAPQAAAAHSFGAGL
jgi:ATP-dependent RNA helicase RhlE